MRIPFLNRGQAIALDPVCHMEVRTKTPGGGTYRYNEHTYYFCGAGCNRTFQKEPEAYISGRKMIEM